MNPDRIENAPVGILDALRQCTGLVYRTHMEPVKRISVKDLGRAESLSSQSASDSNNAPEWSRGNRSVKGNPLGTILGPVRKEDKLKARMYSCHDCGRIMTVDYPPTHNKFRDYVDKPLVRPGPAGFRQGKGWIVDRFKFVYSVLELPQKPNTDISDVYLKKNILQSLRQLFGEEGAKRTVDILKYDPKEHRFVLRCTDDCYVRLRAALTLAERYEEPEPSPGLLLPNGDINWNCPCLGGMATGPCGLEFREAFSCFHYSTADPKGSDCYEAFKTMQVCMTQYPALYGHKDTNLDDFEEDMDPSNQNDKDSQAADKVSSTRGSLESKREERSEAPRSKKELERTNVN